MQVSGASERQDLRAAIRFALEKQLHSLESQRSAGSFVVELLEICRSLIDLVRDVSPRAPLPAAIQIWQQQGALKSEVFRRGVEVIEWTAEERGLAGLSELEGIPWAMSMEQFFEAWVETLMSRVARQVGGMLRTGRERQTVMPLTWEPPYLGSQKSLIPDLVIERGDTTTIIDAKYKEHWGGNARTAVVRPGGGTAGASPRRPSSSARVLYGRADS